tara:strand:+ start:32 stop:283 length:252 start_codon:yes stop_codon:yes gene_type:complete
MDYKFLDKVVDQIISETIMDYDRKVIETPFRSYPFSIFLLLVVVPRLFSIHCRDIYGLNDNEIEYVWKEYREIIKDKINSNGL